MTGGLGELERIFWGSAGIWEWAIDAVWMGSEDTYKDLKHQCAVVRITRDQRSEDTYKDLKPLGHRLNLRLKGVQKIPIRI